VNGVQRADDPNGSSPAPLLGSATAFDPTGPIEEEPEGKRAVVPGSSLRGVGRIALGAEIAGDAYRSPRSDSGRSPPYEARGVDRSVGRAVLLLVGGADRRRAPGPTGVINACYEVQQGGTTPVTGGANVRPIDPSAGQS
jgi:hypothetical protein